ncbi:MAG: tetratricopeptide (TPR) repeat protein [Pseudoalteromonas tetraodonis]|jgi:tetratricopeptide (TPR) repeat protein
MTQLRPNNTDADTTAPFFIYDEDELVWRHLSAAEGYTELGMYAEAHRELDLADQHSEFRLDVAKRKLNLYLMEERWKDAAIYGEIMTEFDPDEPSHFMKYATALHGLGRTDTAIYALSLAPSKAERDPNYQFRLAAYELEAGFREEALYHLENALALNPELKKTALLDPELADLVLEVPPIPRFVASEPEYDPEEYEDVADAFMQHIGSQLESDEDFDCPF